MVRNSASVARQSLDAAGTPRTDTALLPGPMIHLRHQCTLGCVIYHYFNFCHLCSKSWIIHHSLAILDIVLPIKKGWK